MCVKSGSLKNRSFVARCSLFVVRGSWFVGRRVFGIWFLVFGPLYLDFGLVRTAQKSFFVVFREKNENNSCNSNQRRGLFVSRSGEKTVKRV